MFECRFQMIKDVQFMVTCLIVLRIRCNISWKRRWGGGVNLYVNRIAISILKGNRAICLCTSPVRSLSLWEKA